MYGSRNFNSIIQKNNNIIKNIKQGKFDEKINKFVQKNLDQNSYVDWSVLSYDLFQVKTFWRKLREHYYFNIKKPTCWSKDEIDILIRKVAEIGKKWNEIRKFIPKHDEYECKKKFSSLSKNYKSFTKESRKRHFEKHVLGCEGYGVPDLDSNELGLADADDLNSFTLSRMNSESTIEMKSMPAACTALNNGSNLVNAYYNPNYQTFTAETKDGKNIATTYGIKKEAFEQRVKEQPNRFVLGPAEKTKYNGLVGRKAFD